MKRLFAVGLTVLVGGMMIFGIIGNARADVHVSIGVGDTGAEFHGLTSPQSFVTMYDGPDVIGTTVADANGQFNITGHAMSPGIHEFAGYAIDKQGTRGSLSPLSLSLTEHFTAVTNIFLAPTVRLPKSVTAGRAATVSGYTFPDSKVALEVDSGAASWIATADSKGFWTYNLPTHGLIAGPHNVVLRASSQSGDISALTDPQTFDVVARTNRLPLSSIATSQARQRQVPLTPPVITSPADNTHVSDDSLLVQGTAPLGAQIILMNNGSEIGATIADDNGHWQLQLTLSHATYVLTAKACQNGSCSLVSAPVRLYAAQLSRPPEMQLQQYTLMATTDNPEVTLRFLLGHGTLPSNVQINWGDGETNRLLLHQTSGALQHRYAARAGQYKGTISVVAPDGKKTEASFVVIVNTSHQPVGKRIIISLGVVATVSLSVITLANWPTWGKQWRRKL